MDAEKLKLAALEWWNWWESQSLTRKSLVTFGGTLMLALLGFIWWSAQPEYVELQTGLPLAEMSAVTAKLKAKGIPYKLEAGGTSILVRSDQAPQIFVDLSGDGVLGEAKLGKGAERAFDPSVMFGGTQSDRDRMMVLGHQSDLARSLMQIDPIVYARVFIAKSQTSFFVRQAKPATASVLIKLRAGSSIERKTLVGIAKFVASSVEGLHADDVRIMDGSKKMLYEGRDSDNGFGGSMADHQRELEVYLAEQAKSLLTTVLGPGRVVVTVRTDLNSKFVKERIETPQMDGKVPDRETTKENNTKSGGLGTKGGATGLGGANRNTATDGQNTNTKNSESDVIWRYPLRIQEIIQKYGDIERLSIAAVVDLSTTKPGETAMTQEAVQELIKSAIGFKSSRGDQIRVEEFKAPPVSNDTLDDEWASHQQLQTILTIVRNGSIAAVTLCLGVLGFVYLRRRLANAAAAATLAARAAAPPDKLERISAELSRNPEVLAKVLSRWIEQSEAPNRIAA